MGFRTGSYCRVFGVEPKSDTLTQLRIAISHKNKESGEYIQDFSGFVACVGTAAAKKAANLNEGDRIRLGDVDVTNTYNKERGVTYTNYKIFSFDVEGSAENASPEASSVDSGEQEPVEDTPEESNLPF